MTAVDGVEVDLDTLYSQAVDWLDETFIYFLTHVLNMGTPVSTSDVDTAAVSWNTDLQRIEFWVNPTFAAGLSPAEFAFVLSHETMHAKLGHPQVMSSFQFPKLYNLAADAVINDWLIDLGLSPPDSAITGESLVGRNCANSTVVEIYQQLVRDNAADGDACGLTPADVSVDGSLHAPVALPTDVVDSLELPGDSLSAVASKVGNVTDLDAAPGLAAGTGDSGVLERLTKEGISLAWVNLLRELCPDLWKDDGRSKKVRNSYHSRRRKLIGLNTSLGADIALPVSRGPSKKDGRDVQKPLMVLALDTSGSISHAMANRFVNLALSVPQDKVQLWVCTFTTQYRVLDLNKPSWFSGGTDFSAIERFIRAQMSNENKPYPKAVVVVTDGYASFRSARPTKEQEQNWFWLLEGGRLNVRSVGRQKPLKDFIKK